MRNTKNRTFVRDNYFSNEHLRSGIKTRALRGAGATVFSQVSVYGIQMIGTIILARLLAPSDFGLVAMVYAFSFLFQNFGLSGFTEATVQSDEIDHKKISTLFWIHMALSIAVIISFMALAPVFSWFYKEPRLVSITIVIAISFIFPAMYTQHHALLTRNMRFYRITANEIVATIAGTGVAIVMAWQGGGYWALVARRVVPLVAIAVGAWILCRWVPGLPARRTGVRPMMKFGINTYGYFAANYFSRNLDKVLIGWRYGAQPLGLYERAYYLFVMPVSQLSHPLTNVAVAALSRLRDDTEKYRSYYLKALSMLAFIGMPLSAVLTLTGRDLLLLLLGSQWNESGVIFTVFGPAIGITIIYGTHGWLHLSLGRADRWMRWGIIELIVSALAFAVGLPFGAIGVAIAYTASFYVLAGPGLWYAARLAHIKLSSILSVAWRYFVSALIAGLMCWLIFYSIDVTSQIFSGLNIFVRILVSTILCTIFYILFIVIFFQKKESLSEFLSLARDMLPDIRIRNSKN